MNTSGREEARGTNITGREWKLYPLPPSAEAEAFVAKLQFKPKVIQSIAAPVELSSPWALDSLQAPLLHGLAEGETFSK